MIPPLHLLWSNAHIEGYGSTLFNFAWPFLEIFLGLWMFGIIVVLITRLYGSVLDIVSARYKSSFLYWITGNENFVPYEDRENKEDEEEFHEPSLLEWAWDLFTGRARRRPEMSTELHGNPWYLKVASFITGKEIDRYTLQTQYPSQYNKLMNAMWIMTGDPRYMVQDHQKKKAEFSFWRYVLFGVGRPPKKQQEFNYWRYILFGTGKPPKKQPEFNFWLYTFLGIGRLPKGGNRRKSFKPSLMMWYLTRDKRYLGGGLTPAFWPDVISEGFFLAFMGRRARRRKTGGKSSQGQRKAAQRSRQHRQRLTSRQAGVIRRDAKQARIERRWKEGSLDYHLRGPVRIKQAKSEFADHPRMFRGTFGKYQYKVGFRDDGSLNFAYLYGKRNLLAGWQVDDDGKWNPVNSPRYNYQHRAVMERIISQIKEERGK
ncbi:MAG: hypothetical protein QW100_02260 [Thermoplasmatales archaeon]